MDNTGLRNVSIQNKYLGIYEDSFNLTKVFEGNCTVLDHKGSSKVPILLHIFKDFLYGKYEIPLVYI